jgi:uncharacterized protein (DUF58 family)
MTLTSEKLIAKTAAFQNLELLANQVVEGFISGMHKSPFHGFSAEFAEHKIYNTGESTKHIDWKLFARTDRLYTKRFEEETNLRCHFIIDNSASMHYPKLDPESPFYANKIGFSIVATAVLMNLLKKQRDAFGMSIYADTYQYYAAEKGSERHHRMLLNRLENITLTPPEAKSTNTVDFLHQIAEKIHRRSMIVLFTDMFQNQDEEALFKALQHLKHNKHKVIVFHTYSRTHELEFDFSNTPKKFIDIETGESINLFADNVKAEYHKAVQKYFEKISLACSQYRIKYIPVAVEDSFDKVMLTYLTEKQKFG